MTLLGEQEMPARHSFETSTSGPSDGLLAGVVIGAAIVGGLWLLMRVIGSRSEVEDIDPYENVPFDDEPLSAEELRQITESEADIARGEVYRWEEVMRRTATG